MILEQINGPEELKALPPEDLKILAQEIRTFLIFSIRKSPLCTRVIFAVK